MLSGEGNAENREKKATLHVQHTFFVLTFLCRCFWQLRVETSRNFLQCSYTFYGGNVVRVLVHFFSMPLIFTLHWWLLAFLVFSPPLQKFHVVLPTTLALEHCRPFSRWASLACRLHSLFPCLSLALHSKFLDMTINLSLILYTCRFRLYLLFSCLCITRRGWLCDFPPK